MSIILGGGLAAGASARAESVRQAFDGASIKRLSVASGNGNVTIHGGTGHGTTVVANKIAFDASCRLEMATHGDTLVIVNREPSRSRAHNCEVRFEIEVPRQTLVDVDLGQGNLGIADMRGDVAYQLGSGDITVTNADLGALKGRSGSGDVTVSGSLGQGQVTIGAGDATITLNKAPPKGRLDLKLGTGHAVVKLPKDSKVRSSFRTGLGSLTNEFAQAPDAAFTVSGSAGSGDMTIKRL